MKKLAIIFALWATPGFAADGWISLQYQKSTDARPFVNKQIIPDGDIARIAAWAAKTYFANGVLVPGKPAVPAVLDANGAVITPEVPAVPDSYRPPTAAEVSTALTNDVYAGIKRQVEAWYLAQAEAAARTSVAPISLTPAP
jgi:hypothetical protein